MAILFLGAVGLLCCGLTGPVAWALGKRALDQIDASDGAIGGRTQVMIGYILGVVCTILGPICMGLLFLMVACTGG